MKRRPASSLASPCRLFAAAAWAVGMSMMLGSGLALAQVTAAQCGDLANAFGPYDYRTERGQPLYLVESAHFTSAVEALIRGNTSGAYPGGDLDYTLRAFPNHHRALASTARLAERDKTPKPRDMRYSIDCWFERAVRFRKDDFTARMMFANHLAKTGRKELAAEHLAYVGERVGDSPFTVYNLGLLYFEIGDFERALALAQQAEALGFPRPDLKERLKTAGKWVDRPAAAASAPPAAVSAAASGEAKTAAAATPAAAAAAPASAAAKP